MYTSSAYYLDVLKSWIFCCRIYFKVGMPFAFPPEPHFCHHNSFFFCCRVYLIYLNLLPFPTSRCADKYLLPGSKSIQKCFFCNGNLDKEGNIYGQYHSTFMNTVLHQTWLIWQRSCNLYFVMLFAKRSGSKVS